MPDDLTTTDTKADLPEDLKALIARKAINDKLTDQHSRYATNYIQVYFFFLFLHQSHG